MMNSTKTGQRRLYPALFGCVYHSFYQDRLQQPYVIDDLCIGCGICEYKCPLPGRSAIIVTRANEDRNPAKRIPSPSASPVSPYG